MSSWRAAYGLRRSGAPGRRRPALAMMLRGDDHEVWRKAWRALGSYGLARTTTFGCGGNGGPAAEFALGAPMTAARGEQMSERRASKGFDHGFRRSLGGVVAPVSVFACGGGSAVLRGTWRVSAQARGEAVAALLGATQGKRKGGAIHDISVHRGELRTRAPTRPALDTRPADLDVHALQSMATTFNTQKQFGWPVFKGAKLQKIE